MFKQLGILLPYFIRFLSQIKGHEYYLKDRIIYKPVTSTLLQL